MKAEQNFIWGRGMACGLRKGRSGVFGGRVKGPTGWWLPGRAGQRVSRVRPKGRPGHGVRALNVIPRRLAASLD